MALYLALPLQLFRLVSTYSSLVTTIHHIFHFQHQVIKEVSEIIFTYYFILYNLFWFAFLTDKRKKPKILICCICLYSFASVSEWTQNLRGWYTSLLVRFCELNEVQNLRDSSSCSLGEVNVLQNLRGFSSALWTTS